MQSDLLSGNHHPDQTNCGQPSHAYEQQLFRVAIRQCHHDTIVGLDNASLDTTENRDERSSLGRAGVRISDPAPRFLVRLMVSVPKSNDIVSEPKQIISLER
ncbi:MAG TPA: hypothetical protein VFA77_07460, partial [Candidatus Eisenbacteria bacterium]|nr:hypothetical protein [Candidatus Eisenbacteria bacterium]